MQEIIDLAMTERADLNADKILANDELWTLKVSGLTVGQFIDVVSQKKNKNPHTYY
jgi:hypothetical protein